MSRKQTTKKGKYRNQKRKSFRSFNAINSAFNKVPQWRQKEIAAQKRKEKKRQKLIDSVKCMGDDNDDSDGFNAFDALFDNENDNENSNTNNNNTDNNNGTTNQSIKKNTHRRKRSNSKKRRRLYDSSQDSATKKRKLNQDENEYKDEDFEDKGIIIKTVHSKNNNNTNSSKNKKKKKIKEQHAIIAKKKAIISQIHRFEINQLMVENIPIEFDGKKLNNYLSNLCSIECMDIHLFHNIKNKIKFGKAILSFETPTICAMAYKYLFGKSLIENDNNNKVLLVKPISNRYNNYNTKTFDFDDSKNKNKHRTQNNKCKVIKMSNLHWKTSEKDIHNFFKPIGVALTINIEVTQDGYTNGTAKAQFKNYKCVNNAIDKLNDCKLLNRNIKLEKAITKQIFEINGKEFKNKTLQIAIFNISQQMNENDLKEFITNEIGNEYKPTDIHLIHHLEIFTTGYAFCKFKTFDITNIVVKKLNNKILCDRPLRVIWSKPSKVYKLRKKLTGKTKELLLTNLRYNLTKKDIEEFISDKFDFDIKRIDIFENAKGFRYGMGKIWVSQYEYADMIVKELNGKLLKGKVVNINYWENNNKGRKGGKYDRNGKKKNNLRWNDDWFKKNVDGKVSQNKSKGKMGIKVPQRLLDQIL